MHHEPVVSHHRQATSPQAPRAASDLRWGISRAVIITSITWVPATLVFLVSGAVLHSEERRQFARMAAAYLLLAVMGGVVLGLGRSVAARSRWGAAAVGAWIGAQSLLLGFALAGTANVRDGRLMAVSASIGALGGAGMGLWFRARAKVWAVRAGRIDQAP